MLRSLRLSALRDSGEFYSALRRISLIVTVRLATIVQQHVILHSPHSSSFWCRGRKRYSASTIKISNMTLDSPPVLELPNDSPSQSPSIETPSKSPSTYAIISKGCVANNLTEVLAGIQAAFTHNPQKDQDFLSWTVRRAVYSGKIEILRHLLEHEGAQLDRLPPGMVALSASIPLLQLLFDHGWDINQSDGNLGGGKTLLQYVCGDESPAHWCLDHGALVEDRHPDPYRCPP